MKNELSNLILDSTRMMPKVKDSEMFYHELDCETYSHSYYFYRWGDESLKHIPNSFYW